MKEVYSTIGSELSKKIISCNLSGKFPRKIKKQVKVFSFGWMHEFQTPVKGSKSITWCSTRIKKLVTSFPGGWGNGYVAIYKDHPLFGHGYPSDIHIKGIPGGLNYCGTSIINNDYWEFGFDTAPRYDPSSVEHRASKSEVVKATKLLKEFMDNYEGYNTHEE